MAIYIGIAGTHSTGKTTYLNELIKRATGMGIKVVRIGDFATNCRDSGLPILENHTFESTLWIIASVIKSEIEAGIDADLVLVDRPVIDAIGYLNAALEIQGREISLDEREYLESLVKFHSNRYDLILQTELDETIELGKGRPENNKFRKLAAVNISAAFNDLKIQYIPAQSEAAKTAEDNILKAIKTNEQVL
ncbi:TPA: AAA family ATPase [Photobacterium damselae]|nr:AAA family ATPase [Photobacterium damselae]